MSVSRKIAALATIMCSACQPISSTAVQTPISGPVLQKNDIHIVNGTCNDSSNTAEGALGTDLTNRLSRYYCDMASITFFHDYKGHVLVQFLQKEARHGQILGFAGRVEDNGIMMSVEHVYFTPGESTTVSEGWCQFFLKGRYISGIFCGMKVDETGRRTTAIVAFDATPGSEYP